MQAKKYIELLAEEDSKLCNHSIDEYCENCFNEYEGEIDEELEEQDYDEA